MLANGSSQTGTVAPNAPQTLSMHEPQQYYHHQKQQQHDQKMVTSQYDQHQASAVRPMQLPVQPHYISVEASKQQHQPSTYTHQQAYAKQRAQQQLQYQHHQKMQPLAIKQSDHQDGYVPYDGNHPLIGHPDLAPPGEKSDTSAAASFFAR